MGACGSKDAIPVVDTPTKEASPPVKAPVVVEKKKEPEQPEPPPEESEENPGYEMPAMVSASASMFLFELFRVIQFLGALVVIYLTMTIGSF